MIWVAWRQHRVLLAGVLTAFGILAGLYVLVPSTELDSPGLLPGVVRGIEQVHSAVALLPGLVGMLVGAPLVAVELEQRTQRYAWTQGVRRHRWLGTKMALLGGAVVVVAAAFAAVHAWWFAPVAAERGWFASFNLGPVSFPAACLFAFALGTLVGLLLRQAVNAMAVTLVVWIAILVVLQRVCRPMYQPPRVRTGASTTEPSAWMLDSAMRRTDNPRVQDPVSPGWTHIVTYQPGERFALFQWIEGGVLFGLTALCLALIFRAARGTTGS